MRNKIDIRVVTIEVKNQNNRLCYAWDVLFNNQFDAIAVIESWGYRRTPGYSKLYCTSNAPNSYIRKRLKSVKEKGEKKGYDYVFTFKEYSSVRHIVGESVKSMTPRDFLESHRGTYEEAISDSKFADPEEVYPRLKKFLGINRLEITTPDPTVFKSEYKTITHNLQIMVSSINGAESPEKEVKKQVSSAQDRAKTHEADHAPSSYGDSWGAFG